MAKKRNVVIPKKFRGKVFQIPSGTHIISFNSDREPVRIVLERTHKVIGCDSESLVLVGFPSATKVNSEELGS